MKKRKWANLVMVAVICCIVLGGIAAAGGILGWFDKPDSDRAVLTEIRGVVNLEREKVSFSVREDTALRAGDQLSCEPGATAVIRTKDGYVTVGEKARLEIADPSQVTFTAEVKAGEAFVHTTGTVILRFSGKELPVTNATAGLSVRSGAVSLSVYGGSVEQAAAGQMLNWVGDDLIVGSLPISSLNDFAIGQLREAGKTTALCFTEADIEKLLSDRRQSAQELFGTLPTEPTEAAPPETTEAAETQPEETTPSGAQATQPKPTIPSPTAETQSGETDPPATQPPATTAPTEPPATEPPAKGGVCTITIRCDTILNHMDDLNPAKVEFVPLDGVILYPVTISFSAGETVFDVLRRACDSAGIPLEYSWTPMFDSYYIEGINNLYEFDCGELSGWMYKVNGWFPNYGCSSYPLKDGDQIVWCYTCEGLGADVGGSVY